MKRVFIIALLLGAGCATTQEEHERNAAAFRTSLQEETRAYFATNDAPLTLCQAVELARTRSLKLTQQELETQLSRINRLSTFSAFLPNVGAVYGRGVSHGDATVLPYLNARDQRLFGGDGALFFTQPVFTPVSWIMFAECGYGVRIKDLVRDRARELLDAQVAGCFYRAAVAERMVQTYRLRLDGGHALTNQISRLATEGYALPADLARAEARLANDELGLLEAEHARDKARHDLCEILKFWPFAEFDLDGDSILSLPRLERKSVEEYAWDALLRRKDLLAGDEAVELRKAQVVEALAGFLPNIVLGGAGNHLSIEQIAMKGWAGGLIGVWSVFEGFRTIQSYRAARATREAEFRLREDRMLAVVVSVADAWRNWQETGDRARAAHKALRAARLDYEESERRRQDGEETMNSVLDKLAAKDAAEVRAVSTDYAAALAEVVMRQAVGLPVLGDVAQSKKTEPWEFGGD
ncbi:MAG: TolC family protein [bacterium]|nr:TolC family protein [bacterium]